MMLFPGHGDSHGSFAASALNAGVIAAGCRGPAAVVAGWPSRCGLATLSSARPRLEILHSLRPVHGDSASRPSPVSQVRRQLER